MLSWLCMTRRTVDATLLIALCRISIEFTVTDKPKRLSSSGQVILSVLTTHLKGSWLFSCLGSLKTRKFIKHILSSVKKAFFFCISTDFRKTMEGSIVLITILKGRKLTRHVFKTTGANRFLIYRRCKFNLRLHVYKRSNFEIKKGEVKILTGDKISIKKITVF